MPKPFYSLFQREFSSRVWQLWGFFLAAALLQPLVYWISLENIRNPMAFESTYLQSAAPVVLAVLFAGLMGWMIWMSLRDVSSGSICTLMMLPGGRGKLFWAKLLGYAGSVFLLLAGVVAGISLCYPIYLSWRQELARQVSQEYIQTAGLWLSLTRLSLFRMLCPMTFPEILTSLLLLETLPVWACYTSWRIAGRRWIRGGILSLTAALAWALVFRDRLMDPMTLNLPNLILLLILTILMAADSLWLLRRGDL